MRDCFILELILRRPAEFKFATLQHFGYESLTKRIVIALKNFREIKILGTQLNIVRIYDIISYNDFPQ